MNSAVTTSHSARTTGVILLRVLMAFLIALGWTANASAQVVNTYINPTDGPINGSTTCGSPLVRNFNVLDSFVVSDVDLGFFATHSWRGDIRLTLQSPLGTRVQLVNGDASSTSGDNLNARLSDENAQTVNTDNPTGNHSTTTPPPFANDFSPNSPLSAFDGELSAGIWRLEICDIYTGADDGTFRHAELYLTELPTNIADLSINKSVSNSNPSAGSSITYTIQVQSSAGSTGTATGVEVTDLLPSGTTYVTHSGPGSYNSGTGIWQIGSLAPGASATLSIQATVNATAGATVINSAEIIASSLADLDSTVNNGANGEDDYDTVSFTVSGSRTAGIPPVLSCPAGTSVFDWSTRTWSAGATSNSYAFGGLGTISFNMVNPGQWLNNATFGGQSPSRQNGLHAGTFDWSVVQLVNLASRDDLVTTTISLPAAMPGAQFTIFDVDFGNNQFADRVIVEGRLGGSVVYPSLTNGVVNYVIGNAAYGDGASNNDSANGNVVVTFAQPIDTILIYYGDHSLAPSNPGQQAIALHDMTFCSPSTTIEVSKVSYVVSDPVNGAVSPRAIPGAIMEYCILIQNSGTSDATSVIANDPLPADMTFVTGSIVSGTSCATASQSEDDNASGSDETDPFGASFVGGTVTATAPFLAAGSNFAFTFRAAVN